MRVLFSLAVMAILLVTSVQSFAQSATVQAVGTVLAPMTVSGSNLNFGASIFPGSNMSVAHTDGGAAQFDINGETGKEVTATFTLPTALNHTIDATATMPISFSAANAGYATLASGQGTATTYDPSSTLTTTLGNSLVDDGQLYIWLGGTVQPSNTQMAGDYAADITLDLAYTGN